MSKMFKRVAALLLAVALIAPGIIPAFADNTSHLPDPTRPATITIYRHLGTDADVDSDGLPTGAPIPGVPIRIRQAELAPGVIPSDVDAVAMAQTGWESLFVFTGLYHYGVTDVNGRVSFPVGTDHGIWVVEELETAVIGGATVTNPVLDEDRMIPFVVSAPMADEDGEWIYDIVAHPKSPVDTFTGGYKTAVYYYGPIQTWELGVNIPRTIGIMPYVGVVDVMTLPLRFVPGSVEGRFTEVDDASNDWHDVSGELEYGVHFNVNVVTTTTGERVEIALTPAGILLVATEGLLGAGNIMFRLNTEMTGPGRAENNAAWVGNEPCDPEEEDCDPYVPCDPEEEDCDEIGDYFYTFNLEVQKMNAQRQMLQGAEFAIYRELTERELTLLPATPTGAREITAILADGETTATFYVVPLGVTGTTDADGITRLGGSVMSSEGGAALWLHEVTPPTGYRVIRDWIPLNVSAATADDDFIVEIEVFNEPDGGWNLPQTGGVGTVVLTVAGLALVGGALVLFVGSKKEEDVA